MKRRYALLSLALTALTIIVGLSAASSNNQFLTSFAYGLCGVHGVVNKTPCEDFTVRITFRNTGKTSGTWSVNIAFEDEEWTWSGAPKTLTLEPCSKRTLSWNGNVPEDAPIGSLARLIVYYGDSFEPLDLWINIINGAELTITSSTVE